MGAQNAAWWEWKTARRNSRPLSQRLACCSQGTGGQGAAVQLGRQTLWTKNASQWKAIYSLHHERGGKHERTGALLDCDCKGDFCRSLLRSCCRLVHFLYFTFFVLFPVVVWWAAFLYYRRQWRTPSRVEFLTWSTFSLLSLQGCGLRRPAVAHLVGSIGLKGRSCLDEYERSFILFVLSRCLAAKAS